MRKVDVQKVERVFEDRFAVDRATLRFEQRSGTMSGPVDRLCVERGDAVAVLLRDRSTRELILVRQFRYATLRHGEPWLLEAVAGMRDEGESPEETARREVLEETGYRLTELRPIAEFYSSPGGMSEKLHIFFAEVGPEDQETEGGGVEDEHEDLELVRLTPEEAFRQVDVREIKDGKTLVALLWLRATNI